ncbi:MAG: hypothetical protein DMF49_08965 [Acidobacteria bacterium]|nr:MAG: hypothetical protein DMF49_08965 [Acidobacteriota bacterium]
MHHPSRPLLIALCAATLATGVSLAATKQRVVIIGFDGADAGLVEKWMDQGKLPNLQRLRAEGVYSPLLPTNPPQTPVSWSTFATGCNPGKTEIFDFLKRQPNSYIPTFAMVDESRKPFLFGAGNPLAAAGALGGLMALLSLGAIFLLRRSLAGALIAALVLGAAGAVAGHEIARRCLPQDVPDAINNRKGKTMWAIASEAGRKVEVFRVPNTFPAEPVGGGRMLSGLGVPDMRGTVGRPTYYTSDRSFSLGSNEFSLELVTLPARSGVIETKIVGPYNKPFYDYTIKRATEKARDAGERAQIRRQVEEDLQHRGIPKILEAPVRLEIAGEAVTIQCQENRATLRPGEWSDWFVIHFPVNWLVDRVAPLIGIGRFQLFSVEPELKLWFSPLNFHPDCHPVPFSYPASFSSELLRQFGLYRTIGWTEDTWSLPSGVGDEQHFLDDLNSSVDKDEQMMEGLLADRSIDLYVQIYSFTDRIGHLFWRFMDPGHPLYDAGKAARYAGEMLKAYQRMDRIAGRAAELAGPDAVLIVCSDHGFSSFRRGVSYNTWLVKNGYMTLRAPESGARTLEDLFDRKGESLFQNVDWPRTKAYAMGLGNIYINLAGREPQGSVLPGEEYEKVMAGIKAGLEQLVDPATGEHPVTRVFRREEIYTGFDPALVPDLRVANNLNYRVSWQTTLGGVPPEVFDDNTKPWSGDHCSNDPSLVRGIFFCNRRIPVREPAIVDIAPTVLGLLGMPPDAGMDGRDLIPARLAETRGAAR